MTHRRAVGALFFANGAVVGTWVCRIPAIQSALGLDHARVALALLAAAAGALLSMPLSGAWGARLGTRRLCAAAGLLCCAVLPVLAVVPSLATLTSALFVFGFVHGALDVAMNAEAAAAERRAGRPIMASFHALFSAGGLAGAALGGWLAARDLPVEWHFLAAAALAGALIARSVRALPAAPRSRRFAPQAPAISDAGRESARSSSSAGAVRALRACFPNPNPAVAPEPQPSAFARGELPSAMASRPGRATRRALGVLGAIAFCSMIGEGSMADWSALFLRDVRGAGAGVAALGYAAFSLAMVAGRLGGDRLIARFGKRTMLRLSGAAAAAGLSAALLFPGWLVALLGFALTGAGFAAVVPIVFSAAAQRVRGGAERAIAAVATTGYFGFLAGPPLIGLIAQRFGLPWGLGLVVATSAACAALAGAVGRTDESLTAGALARIPAAR